MTALAKDLKAPPLSETNIKNMRVAASTTIFQQALVMLDAGGDLIPAADTASLAFMGVALEGGDNSSGADGDISVRVWRKREVEISIAAATQADVGQLIYAVDDQTGSLSTTNSLLIGKVTELVSATRVTVDTGDRVA